MEHVLSIDNVPQRVRDLVSSVAREARRRLGKETRVIWFGSWVRGAASPASDLDIAIDAPGGVSMRDYSALWDWVDELPTLYKIDLVNLNETGDQLRGEILERGIEV